MYVCMSDACLCESPLSDEAARNSQHVSCGQNFLDLFSGGFCFSYKAPDGTCMRLYEPCRQHHSTPVIIFLVIPHHRSSVFVRDYQFLSVSTSPHHSSSVLIIIINHHQQSSFCTHQQSSSFLITSHHSSSVLIIDVYQTSSSLPMNHQ